MADPGSGNPNAVITDPRGGQKNFDIQSVFKQFGYYPTQEEINAISQAFSGTYDPAARGISAVSQYVMAKKAEAERQANDPLAALQKKMEDSVALMKNQVQGLYGQLQDTLSAAPKLFGDLAPDQIQTFLAPLKTAFDQQVATVQGVIAQRGLAASSTENNALAETGQRFQESVFATGLDVGMKSQAAKAAAIQKQIDNLFGLTGHEEGIAGNAAQARSAQNLGQSNLIASLPAFLNAQSAQYDQLARANQGPGLLDKINTGVSLFNQFQGIFKSFKPDINYGGNRGSVPQNTGSDNSKFETPSDSNSSKTDMSYPQDKNTQNSQTSQLLSLFGS